MWTLKSKVNKFAKKTIHLAPTFDCDKFSKIGGPPDVPAEFEWPVWNGKSLSFLMQLKFSEINSKNELPNMPTSGLMYVFYDQEQSTWGFDPADKGSWKILFFPETDKLKMRRYPKDIKVRYKVCNLISRTINTIPTLYDKRIEALNLSEKQEDWYYDYRQSLFEEMPAHQIGGYPYEIQGTDMDLECELVSNGLYCGDESGYNDARAKILEKNREDWTLLLQIDSDENYSMMWGDSGMLYFWIKKQDLEVPNFENVWMILQCF